MKSAFYSLIPSPDYKRNGLKMCIEELYNYSGQNYNEYQEFRFDSSINSLPKNLHFKINDNNKVTDVLSNNLLQETAGITINNRVKKIISKFNICKGSMFKKIWCYHNNRKLDYNFLIVREMLESIDFNNSTFELNNLVRTNKPEEITFYNVNDFLNKRDQFINSAEMKVTYPKELYLKDKVDIFRLPNTTSIIISERLKVKMEIESISGIEYEELLCEIHNK